MKNQKGITLVALVITIVVLLILAAVTVSMVMGENGVLNNSKKGQEDAAKNNAKNAIDKALSSMSTNYNANETEGELKDQLTKSNLENLAPDYTFEVNNNTVKVTPKNGGTTYTATINLDTLTVSSFE